MLTRPQYPCPFAGLDEPIAVCQHDTEVPSFGRDTIRRFARNVSELKKMAAQDFEDILQVSNLIIRFLTITYITTIFLVCDPHLHWSLTPTP